MKKIPSQEFGLPTSLMDLNPFEEGQLLLVNKPLRWTSFDVVKKLRYLLKVKKIGHAGTLDPLATGLLLIGTGKFTKKLNDLLGMDKTYEGIIEIGKTTPSYDLETDFDSESDYGLVTEEALQQAATNLTGALAQIPPVYSAIRVDGKRAYKHARKNEEVKMEPRAVTVHEFTLTKIQLPEVHFTIRCSKGTYIRSLASDFGKQIGVGGYLKALCRTEIGPYSLKDAYSLEDLISQHSHEAR